jgi:hypothetical protein
MKQNRSQFMFDVDKICEKTEAYDYLISELERLLAYVPRVEGLFDIQNFIDEIEEFRGGFQENREELLWLAVQNTEGDVKPYSDF